MLFRRDLFLPRLRVLRCRLGSIGLFREDVEMLGFQDCWRLVVDDEFSQLVQARARLTLPIVLDKLSLCLTLCNLLLRLLLCFGDRSLTVCLFQPFWLVPFEMTFLWM